MCVHPPVRMHIIRGWIYIYYSTSFTLINTHSAICWQDYSVLYITWADFSHPCISSYFFFPPCLNLARFFSLFLFIRCVVSHWAKIHTTSRPLKLAFFFPRFPIPAESRTKIKLPPDKSPVFSANKNAVKRTDKRHSKPNGHYPRR